jgi:hypothetical protein
LREKPCCYIYHTFLLGFPTGWSFTTHQATFLAPLPGLKKKKKKLPRQLGTRVGESFKDEQWWVKF